VDIPSEAVRFVIVPVLLSYFKHVPACPTISASVPSDFQPRLLRRIVVPLETELTDVAHTFVVVRLTTVNTVKTSKDTKSKDMVLKPLFFIDIGFTSTGNPGEIIYKALYGFFLLYKYFSLVPQPHFTQILQARTKQKP
jgi:hypothetical protein